MSANINVNVLPHNMNVRRLAPRVEQFIMSESESCSARAHKREKAVREKRCAMYSPTPRRSKPAPRLICMPAILATCANICYNARNKSEEFSGVCLQYNIVMGKISSSITFKKKSPKML